MCLMRQGCVLLFFLSPTSLLYSQNHNPVATWLQTIANGDYVTRLQATYGLKEIGDPHEAVKLLIHALASTDPYVRKCAAMELGEIGLEPSLSVPALINLLNDPNEEVRAHAAIALAKLGEAAVPALLSVLDNVPQDLGSPKISKQLVFSDGCYEPVYIPAFLAAIALARIGAPAEPALISALQKEKPGATYARFGWEIRGVSAADGLPKLETLISFMNSRDRYDRRLRGLEGIAEWVDKDPAAIPPLLSALSDPDPHIRAAAAMSVAHVKIDFPLAWTHLAKRLTDPDRAVVRAVLQAMGEIHINYADSHISDAVPNLIKILQGDDLDLQALAAERLREIGKPAAAAIPALLLLIKKPELKNDSFRLNDPHDAAISALGSIGGDSETVKELTAILQRGSQYDATVITALGEMGTAAQGAMPAIAERLNSRESYMRREAAQALIRIGAIAVLLSRASILSPEMKSDVIEVLGEQKVKAAEAIDFLLTVLEDRDDDLAGDAARAVGQIGVKNERILRDLTDSLSRAKVAPDAATALARFAPESARALPQLIALLKQRDLWPREAAMRAIAAMGAAGAPAIPALLKTLPQSSDPVVSGNSVSLENGLATEEAITTLLQIGPSAVGPIAEYLKSRENPDLITAIGKFGAAGHAATPLIINFLRSKSSKMRIAAINSLVLIEADRKVTAAALSPLLLDPEPEVRTAAAEEALQHGLEQDNQAAVIQTIANDEFVLHYTRELFSSLVDRYFKRCTSAGIRILPEFPWPPPRFSDRDLVPSSWLGSGDASLSMVAAHLTHALDLAGFGRPGLFSIPGGFAVVTKVERIDEHGRALPEPYRWVETKVPPRNLMEYLSALFLEKPGLFRLIVFAVTDEGLAESQQELKEADARLLFLKGGLDLPPEIGNLHFSGRNCYVLLYEFQKKPGEEKQDIPSMIPARQHLVTSGIWDKISH